MEDTAYEESLDFILKLDGYKKTNRISLSMIVRRHLGNEALSWSHENIINALNKITHLRLDRENIAAIDDLELLGLAVTNVYLQQNVIEKIQNLECLQNLQFLILTGNKIKVVENLIRLPKLALLDLSENEIKDFDIEELPQTIWFLKFNGNPCEDLPDYRKRLIQDLPKLKILDDVEVAKQERRDVGYNISSDEEEEEEEEEDGIDEPGEAVGSLRDVTANMLLRSQSRLEEVLLQHKSHTAMIDDIRVQSVIPPDSDRLPSQLSDTSDSRASSARSLNSRSPPGSRLGSRGSPLPPITKS